MKKHSAFKRWADFVKDERNEIQSVPSSFRFIARFRLASKFSGVRADGYSKQTLNGYDALLKVFLAYTAFEALLESLAENKATASKHFETQFSIDRHNHPFDDLSVSEKIWQNEKLLQVLIDYADVSERSSFQMEALMSFYLGVTDGKHLHAVAKQIRHLVAHGNLTAYGAESIRKENTEALNELAQLILNETYSLFDKYVSEIEAKSLATAL